MAVSEDELRALAEEELAAACSLSFAELSRITPWGDSHRGFSPSGVEVEFERRYLWADQPDGILVEVEVRCPPDNPTTGAEARRIVRKR
ncbi:hypothetical protein [Brevundimonas sp.]|uniref:hypothetical protein n=1 Tax=Brevundimonas sp. TaxID=1871086 RepID=UPI0035B3CD16